MRKVSNKTEWVLLDSLTTPYLKREKRNSKKGWSGKSLPDRIFGWIKLQSRIPCKEEVKEVNSGLTSVSWEASCGKDRLTERKQICQGLQRWSLAAMVRVQGTGRSAEGVRKLLPHLIHGCSISVLNSLSLHISLCWMLLPRVFLNLLGTQYFTVIIIHFPFFLGRYWPEMHPVLVSHASVNVLRWKEENHLYCLKLNTKSVGVCVPKSLRARGSTLVVLKPGIVANFWEICLLSLGSEVFREQ